MALMLVHVFFLQRSPVLQYPFWSEISALYITVSAAISCYYFQGYIEIESICYELEFSPILNLFKLYISHSRYPSNINRDKRNFTYYNILRIIKSMLILKEEFSLLLPSCVIAQIWGCKMYIQHALVLWQRWGYIYTVYRRNFHHVINIA